MTIAHQSLLQPSANKFHLGNGDDGKHRLFCFKWRCQMIMGDEGLGQITNLQGISRFVEQSAAQGVALDSDFWLAVNRQVVAIAKGST